MNYILNEDNYICDVDAIDPTSPVLMPCDETVIGEDGEVDYDASREAEGKAMTDWADEIQSRFGPDHAVYVAPHDGAMIARLDESIEG